METTALPLPLLQRLPRPANVNRLLTPASHIPLCPHCLHPEAFGNHVGPRVCLICDAPMSANLSYDGSTVETRPLTADELRLVVEAEDAGPMTAREIYAILRRDDQTALGVEAFDIPEPYDKQDDRPLIKGIAIAIGMMAGCWTAGALAYSLGVFS